MYKYFKCLYTRTCNINYYCFDINFTTVYRYGQLSGMVEPIAGLVGIFAVSAIKPLLPYALAFAAGAMIYVVVNDIIPESNSRYNYYMKYFSPTFICTHALPTLIKLWYPLRILNYIIGYVYHIII